MMDTTSFGRLDWTTEPYPTDTDAKGLKYRYKSGRVYITIDPVETSTYNPDTDEYETEIVFPVNVYESVRFDYNPEQETAETGIADCGEFTDHRQVSTLRPGTSGQGYAQSFREANTLAVNGILELEQSARWLSKPLGVSWNDVIHSSLSVEEAADQLTTLADQSDTDDVAFRSSAVRRARDAELYELMAFIRSVSPEEYRGLYAEAVDEDRHTRVATEDPGLNA